MHLGVVDLEDVGITSGVKAALAVWYRNRQNPWHYNGYRGLVGTGKKRAADKVLHLDARSTARERQNVTDCTTTTKGQGLTTNEDIIIP